MAVYYDQEDAGALAEMNLSELAAFPERTIEELREDRCPSPVPR